MAKRGECFEIVANGQHTFAHMVRRGAVFAELAEVGDDDVWLRFYDRRADLLDYPMRYHNGQAQDQCSRQQWGKWRHAGHLIYTCNSFQRLRDMFVDTSVPEIVERDRPSEGW